MILDENRDSQNNLEKEIEEASKEKESLDQKQKNEVELLNRTLDDR